MPLPPIPLSHLAVALRVSASTQNQALSALQFLYGVVLRRPLRPSTDIVPASRPRRLPVVLSVPEVKAVLSRLTNPERLAVSLLYGSGLRVLECVSLRVKDVDLERREITVRGGKEDKDRRAPLAHASVEDVRRALRLGYGLWKEDRRRGVRVSGIDAALARKLPNADVEWHGFTCSPRRGHLSILWGSGGATIST